MTRRRRVPLFWSTLIVLVAMWLLLRFALPYFSMWITGAERPHPVPGFAVAIYLLLGVTGALVYITVSDQALHEFLQPVRVFLQGPDPALRHARLLGATRWVLLVLIPILAGGFVYARTAPRVQSPTILRIQHPTIPGAYERLKNPFRGPDDETVKKWMRGVGFAGTLDEARRAFEEAALAEGRVIFQINCRPCHGDPADGSGPMAWGFRLKPADFTDPGTIATVIEAYAFWRVTEGGPGLPPEATPWDSAMPIWKDDLTDDQKWKAVMAAYDLAGVEPRMPERLEAARSRRPVASKLSTLAAPSAWAQARPPETPENIERGKQIYVKRCQVCHGENGDGQGPVAPYLNPRPRDFTLAVYKLRSTGSGDPPTDADLFRVVTRGIPGTAMAGWTTLSEADRWRVVYHIKTFGEDFFDEPGTVIQPTVEVQVSPEVLARGKELYRRAKCWECHGDEGRADGPSTPTLEDDLGNFVQPADLTKGWRIKGGRGARDIFMRFSTGMDGTPMPSFADSFSEEERWALAHYVRSLQTTEEPSASVALEARKVAGNLPTDPDDPRWRQASFLAVPLAGQVLAKPRWQNHSVDAVTVRALYNDQAVALLVEWDDPIKDIEHQPGPNPTLAEVTYPTLNLSERPREQLRDAIRFQFPLTIPDGPERPHFFLGDAGQPVALWHWKADLNETGGNPVAKERGEGFQKPIVDLPPKAQDVTGRGVWRQGRWRVVLSRPLVPKDPTSDVTFEAGRLIPFAVQAWDGSNGEKVLMMSLSSWNFLVLESAVGLTVYLYSAFGVGLVGLGEWWLVHRVRPRRKSPR